MATPSPFDQQADVYDAWFDSPRGKTIFTLELECLREILGPVQGHWLEVGVGTGRFAAALGITTGIDQSPVMLHKAGERGISTRQASADTLPFAAQTFDGSLLVCVFCFLQQPLKALEECRRVLKKDGRLVIGFIPADSAWGRYHATRGSQGHPFYASARFYTAREISGLAAAAGFTLHAEVGCALPDPGVPPDHDDPAGASHDSDSFKVLSFVAADPQA